MSVAGSHRVLVVSEVPLGMVLTAMLQARHVAVDVVESYGRHDAMYASLSQGVYDVAVLTNTALALRHILEVVPEIRLRFSAVNIVVLSGWLEGDFAASLERLQVHDVFKTTEGIEAAVDRIVELVDCRPYPVDWTSGYESPPMTRIYEHWRQLRGDKRLSPWRRARLAAALETFKTVHDLLRLARFWRDSGSSQAEANVRLCLKMAETMATTRDDWGEIAVQYSKHLWIFGRHLGNEALRCMRRAEAVAETSVDWAGFAIDWYRLSGTDTRRQLLRCLGTALAKAKTTHDFGTMASYCMLIFNNLPAAEVLLREAEYRAVTREDWEEIRGIYETSFDDARRAFLSEYPPEVPFEIVNGRVIETDG